MQKFIAQLALAVVMVSFVSLAIAQPWDWAPSQPVNRFLGIETVNVAPADSQRVFMSPVWNQVAAFLLVSGTAYCNYVGRTTVAIVPQYVEFVVTTGGAGAQTAEVGLFSSPAPPSKTNQTLTKIVATGTVDALTTTGVKRNTSPFATTVPAGTHMWGCLRVAMATTKPQVQALSVTVDTDWGQGFLEALAGSGVLTSISTIAGVRGVTAAALRVTLD